MRAGANITRSGHRNPHAMREGRGGRGFALVLVLTAVAVVVVMGTSYVSSAAIKTAGTRNLVKATRAKYVAESGMQHAIYVLWTNPLTMGSATAGNPLGPYAVDNSDARYRFWAAADMTEVGLYHITAQATADGMTQSVDWDIYRTPPYEQVMLAKTPSGYWRLGDTSGWTTPDSSGNNYEMLCLGVQKGVDGGINGDDTAFRFDGHGDFLYRPPTSDLEITTDLTISLWFKMDQLPDHHDKFKLIGCADSGSFLNRDTLYEVSVDSSGKVGYMHEAGGRQYATTFNSTHLARHTWHNLVITRDIATSTVKLYLGGQLIDSWTFGGSGDSKPFALRWGGMSIGRGTEWGDEGYFDGTIDEVAVLNRPLTEEEIKTLYEVGGLPEIIEIRSCGN